MPFGNSEHEPRTQSLAQEKTAQIIATDDEKRQVATEISRLSTLSQSLVATDLNRSAEIGALVDKLRETSYEDPDDGKDTKIPRLLSQASQY